MNTTRLAIALVFLTGCAVGGASARFVVPPASAQQAATLTKWEYMCFGGDMGPSEVEPKSNVAGAQAWEMAGSLNPSQTITSSWCFKRPKL